MALLDYTQLSTLVTNIKAYVAKLYVAKEDGKGLSTNDYTTAEKTKLAGLENYTLPDATDSVKGGVVVGTNISVSSGTISVADGTTSAKGVVQMSDATDSSASTTAATSKAVKAAYDLAATKANASDVYTKSEIDGKLSSTYKPAGSLAPNALVSSLLTAENLGKVYNITGSFSTTSDFVEGAGATHPVGTNVAVVDVGTTNSPSYKFDVLAGFIEIDTITSTEIDALFPELAS